MTMKTTFDFNFWFLQCFQTAWININMDKKRCCKFSAFLCLLLNLLFEQKACLKVCKFRNHFGFSFEILIFLSFNNTWMPTKNGTLMTLRCLYQYNEDDFFIKVLMSTELVLNNKFTSKQREAVHVYVYILAP